MIRRSEEASAEGGTEDTNAFKILLCQRRIRHPLDLQSITYRMKRYKLAFLFTLLLPTSIICQTSADLEASCINSGGTVGEQECFCDGVGDFINTCLIGACTCFNPDGGYNINICECPEGFCFDGTACVPEAMPEPDLVGQCLDSGGTIGSSFCCQSVEDFPSNCVIGACGCAPDFSHNITTCECPPGNCFDGSICVPVDNEMEGGDGTGVDLATSCEGSGGTVVTSTCCQAVESYPDTCLIGACGCAPDSSHEITACECPEGTCFDGTECIPAEHESPMLGDSDDLAAACESSGGTVEKASCCQTASPFPDLCLIGACGCAPDDSADIDVCACPEGSCFNGTACTSDTDMMGPDKGVSAPGDEFPDPHPSPPLTLPRQDKTRS